MNNTIKKKALTLIEISIAMTVMAILIVSTVSLMKPNDIKEEALKKTGAAVYTQISKGTDNLAYRYSSKVRLKSLYTADKSSKFEITDNGATDKLLALYANVMDFNTRNPTSMTYSDYTPYSESSENYLLKNGTFFAVKLYGNCTTETTTTNPLYEDVMIESDTCGAIFYDVNADKAPNELGIDRYIIALDKDGVR